MATDSGYNNQKKKGISQFETIHHLGSSTYGKSISNKGLYEITASTPIIGVTDVSVGGIVQYWNVEFTAHGASVGNVARFLSGSLINYEFEIIQIIDVDHFYILPISDVKPSTENCEIMGWVTSKLGSDGGLTVSVSGSNTQFVRNGAPQIVTEDTGTPANTRPLPVLNYDSSGVEVVPAKESTLQSVLSKLTYAPRNKARIDFSSTNVTSGAWVELISTVGATAIKRVQIFMSQGNALELGFGAAASEVSQMFLFPGGNEVFEMDIPAGTRLSVKAVSSTASTGELLVNLLG
jgi:hypothetical protein